MRALQGDKELESLGCSWSKDSLRGVAGSELTSRCLNSLERWTDLGGGRE
jgi:hypothetical protein